MREPGRIVFTATALVIALGTLAACSTGAEPTTQNVSSPAPTQPVSSLAPTIAPGQTIWHVAQQDGTASSATIADDDADVQAVQKLVALHTLTVDQRSAETIAQSVVDEKAFYTTAFSDSLDANDYAAKTFALFRNSHLATRSSAIGWYVSTLSAERTTARAEIDATFEFAAADEAFLAKNRFALNSPYTQHRTLDLVKRDGRWLIADITKAPLTGKEGNGQ